MTHRVDQRTKSRAWRVRRHSPHGGSGDERGCDEQFAREELSQHLGRRHLAPLQHRRGAASALGKNLADERTARGRLAAGFENQFDNRHGRLREVAVTVDLGREKLLHDLELAIQVVEHRPYPAVRPRRGELCRVDVDVAQTVTVETEVIGDACRTEREMVAVADVDRDTGERLGGGGSAHLASRLDDEHLHAGLRKVGRADEAVVSAADDQRVET